MIDDVQRFLSMDDTSQSVRQGANGDNINSTLKLLVNSTRLAQKQLLLPLVLIYLARCQLHLYFQGGLNRVF